MNRTPTYVAALALLLAAFSLPSYAQLNIGAGVERYNSLIVETDTRQKGTRKVYWLQYIQTDPTGWLFGYQGKAYRGDLDFSTPAGTLNADTVQHKGWAQELQVRYREPYGRGHQLTGLMSAGVEKWREHYETGNFDFDFQTIYLRLGLEYDSFESSGWNFGAGFKLPVRTTANYHLDAAGYDQNPIYKPKGVFSPYAQLGYRLFKYFGITAYADSLRLSDSNPEYVSLGGVPQPQLQSALGKDAWIYGIRAEILLW